jgi:hypothetical protein
MNDPLLTIDDATREFRVSPKTIRRRLSAKEIEGAYKRPGARGPEWVIPRSSLVAAGFIPASSVEPSAVPDTAGERAAYWKQRALAAEATLAREPGHELPYADGPTTASPTPSVVELRQWGRFFVVGALVLALLAVAVVFSEADDGPATVASDPVTGLVAELTDSGDRIGVIGDQSASLLPPERTPVPIAGVIDDADPRFVVATSDPVDGPDPAIGRLTSGARTVLAVERSVGLVQVFDRGAAVAGPVGDPSGGADGEGATATTTVGAPTTISTTRVVTEADDPPQASDGSGSGARPSAAADADHAPTSTGDRSTTVTVELGGNFWGIAEAALTRTLDRAPTDGELLRYWQQVIDANADVLVEPGNRDLLHVGQMLTLPSVG